MTDCPRWLHTELMQAFGNGKPGQDWYPIFNDRANERLCEMLGLTTDYNVHRLSDAFSVRFSWSNHLWYVST